MTDMADNHQSTPLSPDELAYGCLAHFLQLNTWLIGPLILYLVKRDSRYVAFHSLQVVILQGVVTVLWAICFVGFFSAMLLSFPDRGAPGAHPTQPPFFFMFFPIIWLIMMGTWVLSLILGIVYGIKAIRGQWAEYPFLGRWAKKIVGP